MIYNLILLGQTNSFAKVRIETAPIERGHTIGYKDYTYEVAHVALGDIWVTLK